MAYTTYLHHPRGPKRISRKIQINYRKIDNHFHDNHNPSKQKKRVCVKFIYIKEWLPLQLPLKPCRKHG